MKVKLVAFATMAALVAGAFEWNFTKGLPEGGGSYVHAPCLGRRGFRPRRS